MIKNSLKNFFKNLLYIFIPMGIVYLFLLIAVFSLIGVVVDATGTAVTDTLNLIGSSVEESQANVADFLSYSFAQIDWGGNPFETIRTILDTRWLSTTVKGFFDTLGQNTEGFDDQLNAIVATFKNSLSAGIAVAATVIVVGVIGANYATRFAVRSKVAKRNFKQFVIANTLVPIVETLMLVASLWLIAKIKFYSLLVFVLFVILLGVLSLCASYLIYRNGKMKLKDLLTVKNVFKHFAVLCIIAAIDIALAVGLYLLSPLFALLLMIPIIIYSANIVDSNTDSYVSNLAAKTTVEQQTSEEQQTEGQPQTTKRQKTKKSKKEQPQTEEQQKSEEQPS